MSNVTVPFKETTEVLTFVIELVKAYEASMEDEKLNLADVPNFLPAFMKLFEAIEDVSKVTLELEAANKDEVDTLKAAVKAELDLDDDKLEAFIENAFALVVDIYTLVNDYKAMSITGEGEEVPSTEAPMPEADDNA
jgi:hypothetical protein